MTKPIDFTAYLNAHRTAPITSHGDTGRPGGVPSNAVYARVGDVVLHAAQDGVRRGLPPEDIIREIMANHRVRLNRGELRLLLASRRVPVD